MKTFDPDTDQLRLSSRPDGEFTLLPPPMERTPRRSRRAPSRWLVALAVAAVFSLGVVLGNLVAPDVPRVTEASLSETTTTVVPETAPPTTIPELPPTTAATSLGSGTLAPPPADEPVAFVAAVLRPTIVQIDTRTGLGSGFIYEESGLIMTAAHVVEGSTDVLVTFADGTKVDGVVVGQDPISDVAVVSVDLDGPLPVAELALDDALVPGQLAVAIGSPFGLEQTITAGIVSNVSRPVIGSDGTIRDLVQTDASINPGNSGGALADREGRVIGINDLIFSRSGGNDGVGFAIPIGYAKQIADQLVAGGEVETARLGVGGTDPALGTAGALITSVESGSPADLGGLEVGDLVVGLDSDSIQSFVDLAAAVRAQLPGEIVVLTVLRDGAAIELDVNLGS